MKLTHADRVALAKRNEKPTQEEIDQSLSVRKSNQLIQRNRFDLTLREQRLLLYCISKIRPADTGKETYEISIREAIKACGIANVTGGAYNAIRAALKKLDSFNFELQDENHRTHIVHWIRSVVIDPEDKNKAIVAFEFDPKIVPYLFEVKKKFTQYQLRNVLQMKSEYGIRLYELLKSYTHAYRRTGEHEFTTDELRAALCADSKSYSQYGVFKKYVIEPAITDIMTYSDLNVDYLEVKNGRKVAGMRFIMTQLDPMEYSDRQGWTFE